MSRNQSKKLSSVRSELSDDNDSKKSVASFLIGSANEKIGTLVFGNAFFKSTAPNDRGEEIKLKNELLAVKGLKLLPIGLENAKSGNLLALGFLPSNIVKTPFGKAQTTLQAETFLSYSKGYGQAEFSDKASALADLLNDMVSKGQGGSDFFKETDKLYQDVKTARDSGNIGKTTQLNGDRVSDVSGDNFLLSTRVGQGNEKLFFNPMKKAGLTAGEMYTVVRELPSIASRLRDKAYVAGTGQEVVERYFPAKYRNVDSIDSPAWFKVTLQRNQDGYAPVKVKYVTTDKEKQTARESYKGN
jgi:hypothetical protein